MTNNRRKYGLFVDSQILVLAGEKTSRRICAVAALALIAGGCLAAQTPSRAVPEASAKRGARSAAVHADSTTPQAATPQFSVTPGVYSGTQTVSITDTTPGATIYYTTNGMNPYASAFELYSSPFTVSSSEVVVAYAVASGYTGSAYAVGRYIISSVPSSFVYTVAGNGSLGYSGDGGPAVAAQLGTELPLAVDASGNVYIGDTYDNVIRKVSASSGVISTIAGTGIAGSTGDGGPALAAEIDQPQFMAIDNAGDIYIADIKGAVRVIDPSSSNISTLADNLGQIGGLALDKHGNVYVNSNLFNIVKINPTTKVTTTLPSNSYNTKYGLAVDSAGFVYFIDGINPVVDRLDPNTGNITIVAGSTTAFGPSNGDGGPATSARLVSPLSVGFDSADNLYILDEFAYNVREVHNGIISTVLGNGGPYSNGGDGDPALSVAIGPYYGSGFAISSAGNLYFASPDTGRVLMATAPALPPTQPMPAPKFSVAAGTYATAQQVAVTSSVPGASIFLSTDGSVPSTSLSGYYGPLAVPGSMTVSAIASAPGYLPSAPVSAKYTITAPPDAIISTIAGTGTIGRVLAAGPALSTPLVSPTSAVADAFGNIYIADDSNSAVWKLNTASGIMSPFAGTGHASTSGDGGPATAATLQGPISVAVDQAGNVYIADSYAARIRKVAVGTGIITTVAGPGRSNNLGDGGPATSAYIGSPSCVIVDAAGNFYIADGSVRKVDVSTGIITTIAGGGTQGQLGDGGPATAAYLGAVAIAFDSKGNLFINDQANERVRRVDAQTGIITTIAGNGIYGTSGDAGPALNAAIEPFYGIAVDGKGNVYFSSQFYQVRKVDAATGIISTQAGTGYAGFGGDGGAAAAASFNGVWGLSLDSSGNLLLGDGADGVIRKITFPPPAAAPTFSPAAGAYTGVQKVTVTDSTANATIYYTTDGSTPDTGSTAYSAPITVAQNETINAIAVVSGYAESAVATASYTITIPTPSIALTSSANPVAISNPVTFTATLSSTYGTPTGTVTFFDGATQLGSATLSSGVATYTTPSLAVGAHSITAVYGGDSNFTSATSTVLTETVTIPTPSIALTASANPIFTANPVTFTATLSSTYGTPTGTVNFLDGTTQLGSGTLSSGVATYTTSSLAAGAHSITAVYGGDSKFATVTSTALTETVEDFTFAPPSGGSTSATASPGGTAAYTLTVTPPSGGSAAPITFSIAGLPTGATASFNPSSVPANAGTTNVTLTIQLPKSASIAPQDQRPFPEAPLVLGFVLLPFLGLRRFRCNLRGKLLVVALALVGFAGLGAAVGCGGGSGSSSTPQPQTYTLTVTATAGSLSHAETLTLTVQ